MFVLIFTRLIDGTEESIFLEDTFGTKEEAQSRMRGEWTKRVTEMGWDANYSNISENQAFCGDEDMNDTCRYYIFDTEHPYGFTNDINYESFGEDD